MRNLYLSIVKKERKGPLSFTVFLALLPFSSLYYLVLRIRELLYRWGLLRSTSLPLPVISVGNITTGGTGKTPLVEFLTRFLLDKGKKVAILSRGYNGIKRPLGEVNDEYLEFRENLPNVPILLGKNRLSSAKTAMEEYHPNCIILDDGFQHWRLQRVLDVVVIDSLEPFGNGGLIPSGTLREPLRNLRRAGLFILSHTDQCDPKALEDLKRNLGEIDSNIPIVESIHYPLYLEDPGGQRLDTSWLRGKRLYAFCGLGNPLSFQKTLQLLGGEIVGFRAFPDHHHYSNKDIDFVAREALQLEAEALITTQKDMVKLRDYSLWPIPILSLKIEIRITKGLEFLSDKLEKVVQWG